MSTGPIVVIPEMSHDGHSRLDYGIRWGATAARPFLASGEEIATSEWFVAEKPDNALVLTSGAVVSDGSTVIWAQPDTGFATLRRGGRYRITNRITTNQFRREDSSIILVVEDH